MDINDLRAVGTVLAFGAFIGVCVWAWSRKRKTRFEQAANLPFDREEEELHKRSVAEARDD